ncbi:MAG: hypothetical protein WBZ35_17595, partial [Pseudolabrys sp.]
MDCWCCGIVADRFSDHCRLEQQHQYSEQRLFDHNEQQHGAENDAARKHDGLWVVVNTLRAWRPSSKGELVFGTRSDRALAMSNFRVY